MTHLKLCIAIVAIGSMMSAVGCDGYNDGSSTTPAPDTTAEHVDAAPKPVEPDNTANNRGDGSSQALTPIDQSQAAEHIKLTADIRKAVMSDDIMSMTAKNCKIITTSDGVVTLRGIVRSAAEKDAIEAHAIRIAGETNVVNQLEIKVN